MKQVALLMMFCVLGAGVMAQTTTPVELGREEKEVAAAVEMLRKGMIDPDKSTLEKLTLPQLSYGHSNGDIQNQAEFVDKLVSGKSDFVSIDLSEQSIRIVDKTAMVRHLMVGNTNDGGKPGQVKLSILLIWLKQKGEWKLLARQAVKILPAL
jgi:hypothetical protein